MRLVGLGFVAVLTMTVSAAAQDVGSWQPADCASLEANSLEAAVRKCDPAILLGSKSMDTGSASAASGDAASWQPAADDDLLLDTPASNGEPSVIEISSQDW